MKNLIKRIKKNKTILKLQHCLCMSVTIGEWQSLPLSSTLVIYWKVENNDNFKIKNNKITAKNEQLGKHSRGIIRGYIFGIKLPIRISVTAVPWKVKRNALTLKKEIGKYTIMGHFDGETYCTDNNNLFSIKKNKLKHISRIPWKLKYRSDRSHLLKTPVGWFLRTDGGVVQSPDLINWSVAVEIGVRGMFQHLDYYHDIEKDIFYIYAAEYTTEPDRRDGIYQGIYHRDGTYAWTRIYEFYSSKEGNASYSNFPAARHIHVLTVDKKTGYVWIATGDSDRESGIFYSKDHCNTFEVFALGSQEYRTLMLIFTEQYLYWNMDTHSQDQRIYRVHRKALAHPLTKIRKRNGNFIIKNNNELSTRETVATLPYGAQWYGTIIKDFQGKDILLMSASPESQVPKTKEKPHRDWNCRIFAIEELDSEMPVVYEALCAPIHPDITGKAKRYHRIDPRCQDQHGNIYFMAHNSIYDGALIGKLNNN